MTVQLAEQLWRARVDGTLLDTSTVELPVDEDAAYQIQQAITQAAEAETIGFKLGATSEGAMTALGLAKPFFGPIFDRYSHRSDDEIRLPTQHKILLETEIAIGLAKDLLPRDQAYTHQDVEAATAWIAPAFEFVATRLNIELAGNGKLLIADGGVNADFVLGEPIDDWSTFDLTRHPAILFVNGKEVARGHSGMSVFSTPFAAVAWLANHAKLRHRGLKADDVITTGTTTGMTHVVVGDQAEADLGQMGKVRMRLAAP